MKPIFHLIDEKKIAISATKKVIPAKDFSTLLFAEELLEELHRDKEQMKADLQKEKEKIEEEKRKNEQREQEYRSEVVSECEKIKEQSIQEGFDAGFHRGMKKWLEAIAMLREKKENERKTWESQISLLAFNTAKRIVGDALKNDSSLITSIVKQNLKGLSQCSQITVQVNPQSIKELERERESLRSLFEKIEIFVFEPREDVELGSCIIETEKGIVDARLDNLWDSLEKIFSQYAPSHTHASDSDQKQTELPKEVSQQKNTSELEESERKEEGDDTETVQTPREEEIASEIENELKNKEKSCSEEEKEDEE